MLHTEGGPAGGEDFRRAIREVCGDVLQPVGAAHKLVDEQFVTEPIAEFYSDKFGSRMLAIPYNSRSSQLHVRLAEVKLPVFSSLYTNDLLLLLVPEGAMPVEDILLPVARDPGSYGQIFFEVGRVLRSLEEHGLGLPVQSVLSGLAFAADEKAEHGARLFLIPPYDFSSPESYSETMDELETELEINGLLDESSREIAMANIRSGWHAIG